MKRCIVAIGWLVLGLTYIQGQSLTYEKADSLKIVSLLKNTNHQTTLDFARQFLGIPYVAHTLEVNDEEQLVVNTRELDCTTLVETVAALTLCAQKDFRTFDDYTRLLCQLRYRNGILNGYTSRLHYFSDWILDKQRMGFVEEVQQPNPPFSAVQRLNVFYMSSHPNSYKALTAHPELVKEIARQEQALTGKTCRYIPKAAVKHTKLMRSVVKDGDIIAITCSKQGLEIAHLGFAVWKKDGLHLLNASMIHKKVVEEPLTLYQYLTQHKSHTGIRVIRINN